MGVNGLSMLNGEVHEGSSQHVSLDETTIYWQGFVYIEGFVGQQASMLEFARLLRTQPIEKAVSVLKGSFFCIVEDTDNCCFHAFVDNAGMFAAYSCKSGASRFYLALVDSLGLGMESLNWANIAEFIQTANFYSNRSHFDAIRKIGFDDILEYTVDNTAVANDSQDNSDASKAQDHATAHGGETLLDLAAGQLHCRRLQKSVAQLSDAPEHQSLAATFDGLATALEGTQVSADVTGGLDTRTLIAGLEAAGISYETSLSGTDSHVDVVLARKVAAAIEKPLFVTQQDIGNLDAELQSTMESLDGLKSHVLTQHRILQLQNARRDRGMQLSLRGHGGELYRDFKWAQDFPFYLSRKTRFERYDRLRVEVVRLPEKLLSDRFREISRKARDRRMGFYKEHLQRYNSQSYDTFDFYQTLQNNHSRAMSVSSVDPVMTYCPLAEVYRLQHGYHCSRLLRFGAFYQKHFITRCHAGLARVQTSYRGNASTELPYMLKGAFALSVTNVKKLIRKLSQTYLGKSPFTPKVANHDDGMQILRASPICKQAFETLKRHDVLAESVDPDEVTDRFMERLIYTGWFIQRLESQTRQRKRQSKIGNESLALQD